MEGEGLYGDMVHKMLEKRPKVMNNLLMHEGKQILQKYSCAENLFRKHSRKLLMH